MTTADNVLLSREAFASTLQALRTHDAAMNLAFNAPPAAAPSQAAAPAPQEFDLSGISLDLDLPTAPAPVAAAAAAAAEPVATVASDFGGIELPEIDEDASDPISRKLELAEEFRQIGDTEGARDLLQEVIAKADGALKTKAQGMLDALA